MVIILKFFCLRLYCHAFYFERIFFWLVWLVTCDLWLVTCDLWLVALHLIFDAELMILSLMWVVFDCWNATIYKLIVFQFLTSYLCLWTHKLTQSNIERKYKTIPYHIFRRTSFLISYWIICLQYIVTKKTKYQMKAMILYTQPSS
jgi:hypothetical protein